MRKQVHLIISGTVQGVFFRADAARVARNLEINGWVKNLPDGSVELLAEGEEVQLQRMIGWCRTGPPNAHVGQLDIQWREVTEAFESFKIK